MNSFLPVDYKAPNSNENYMKLLDGENRFRIMSSPVLGWEDWVNDKPVRFRMDAKGSPADVTKPMRHFWAMIVYNYATETIQVLQIVQARVQKSLQGLCNDSEWGAPFEYDIKILREGKDKLTKYTVIPCPKKVCDEYLIEQFREKRCNLEALYSNEDPFAPHWAHYSKGFFESAAKVVTPTFRETIGEKEAANLQALLEKTPAPLDNTTKVLTKMGVKALKDIPVARIDIVKTWVNQQIVVDIDMDEVPF